MKLVDTASTDAKIYGETMCSWVTKLVWRRLHDVGDVEPEEVPSLLDGLALCWCVGDDDHYNLQGNRYNLDDPVRFKMTAEQTCELLLLSIKHQGGLKVSGPVRFLARDDFDDRSGDFPPPDFVEEMLALPEEEFDLRRKTCLCFPIASIQERLGARFDTSAAIYLTAVLEYMAAEAIELSGKAAEKKKRQTILARDINAALDGDTNELQQTAYQIRRPLDVVLQSHCLWWLGQLLFEDVDEYQHQLERLPLDALLVLWHSISPDHLTHDDGIVEDPIFDSIRSYLNATSPGPEVHARAWQACSFAHLSDAKFGSCSSELLPRIFTPMQLSALGEARDILADDCDEQEARAIMESAGLAFHDRRDSWFSRPKFYCSRPTMPATLRRSSTATADA